MNSFLLKFQVIFFILLMNSICVVAQTWRFIYLQTENKEEFYVKLDKKVLNASPAGYLIIPKLSENTYQLTIGFYEAGLPEISTSVKIKDVNMGFLLKNSDKGWAIFNLQTMQPLAIKKEFPSGREEKAGPNVDEFTRILAEVVGEPSIAWAPVAKTDNEVVTQQVKKTEEEKTPVAVSSKPKKDSGRIKKQGAVVKETKATTSVSNPVTNSNCKKTATESDFLKLRRQMAGEANEKNMIKAANKHFLNTCYSTIQIKDLSILFINEEEKYKFFVAAFPFVSDVNNFGILKNQLTDNYYKTRLNAMINH